jgi:tetratricopeptide (TPR) repeat protein
MPDVGNSSWGAPKLLCALAVLFAAACGSGTSWFLAANARDIERATKAIETARDDHERAHAYDERGRGYSEKARYSKAFNLIEASEYDRVFDLAIADQDRAVALAPQDAEVYLGRGLTYYNRAALEDAVDPKRSAHFASAVADFTAAIAQDGRNVQAIDMRGVVHTTLGEADAAIADFTQVLTLDSHLGKLRLAEAYCERGAAFHRAANYDAAIADYEKSIAYRTGGGGCECQVTPEVLEELKLASRSKGTSS